MHASEKMSFSTSHHFIIGSDLPACGLIPFSQDFCHDALKAGKKTMKKIKWKERRGEEKSAAAQVGGRDGQSFFFFSSFFWPL